MTRDGQVKVLGRSDDMINVADIGSRPAIEEVAADASVAECAVIGVPDELKGQVPCGFVVLKAGVEHSPADIESGRSSDWYGRRDRSGSRLSSSPWTVARLPKTRSGKILRGTMKKMADGDASGSMQSDDRRSGDLG